MYTRITTSGGRSYLQLVKGHRDEEVTDLVAALNDTETKPEAASILRGLIGKIVLTPDAAAANGHAIELFGELGAILSLCDNGMGVNANARTGGAGLRQVTMVAGAGFEPAAFRL